MLRLAAVAPRQGTAQKTGPRQSQRWPKPKKGGTTCAVERQNVGEIGFCRKGGAWGRAKVSVMGTMERLVLAGQGGVVLAQ